MITIVAICCLLVLTAGQLNARDVQSESDSTSRADSDFNQCYSPRIPGYHYLSRRELDSYLAKSIHAGLMVAPYAGWNQPHPMAYDAQIPMFQRIQPKFIKAAAGIWGGEWVLSPRSQHYELAKAFADSVHQKVSPDVIVGAALYEIVTPELTGSNILIESADYQAFGFISQSNTFFVYDSIRYADNYLLNYPRTNPFTPDMSRAHAKMYFYQRARKYIDAGYEALDFGQTHLMDNNDPGHEHWHALLVAIRKYAATKNRHFVLCGGGAPNFGMFYNPTAAFMAAVQVPETWDQWNTEPGLMTFGGCDEILFDYYIAPTRATEVCKGKTYFNRDAEIHMDIGGDAMYGKSMGGINPNGWTCQSNPYTIEFDNTGIQCNHDCDDQAAWFLYGFEEVSWFAQQPREYRDSWLRYLHTWLKLLDPNGFLCVMGYREYISDIDPTDVNCPCNGGKGKVEECRKILKIYSPADENLQPGGASQEQVIKALWMGTDF